MRCNLKGLLLIVAASAVLTFLAVLVYRLDEPHVSATRHGVSASIANRFLPSHLQLPDTASDVTCFVDFGAAEAEFAISEKPFLYWCKSNGWAAIPLTSPTPYFEPLALPEDTQPVTRGYAYAPPDGQGNYDAVRGRACFWTSTFP